MCKQQCTKLGSTVQSVLQYGARTVPSLVAQYNLCYGMGPGLYQAWWHSTIWATVSIQDCTKLGNTVQSVLRYGSRAVPNLVPQYNLGYGMDPGRYQAQWHSTICNTVWNQNRTKLGSTKQSVKRYGARTVPSLVAQYNPCYGMGQGCTEPGGTVQSGLQYGSRTVPSLGTQYIKVLVKNIGKYNLLVLSCKHHGGLMLKCRVLE